jgi:hypothetical protein
MPFDILLAQLWLARAFQGQHLILQADIHVIAFDARQFGGNHNTVFAEPDVNRRKFAGSSGIEPGKQPVHFALHPTQVEKGVGPQTGVLR